MGGKGTKKPSSEPITPKSRLEEMRLGIKKRSEKSKAWKMLFTGLFGLGLAAWVGLVLLVVQYVVAFVFVRVLPESSITSNVVNSVYQVIVYAAALFVAIFVPWKVLKCKTTRGEMGLRGLPTWTDLLLAPIGFIVVLLAAGGLTALMMALMPDVDWQQAQEVGYHGLYQIQDFIMAFVCLVVLAPLCEEIIFRGWLYGKLRFKMPAFPAMLIVSVLFGIMHGQWNVGVTVFAMSMGMCIMREFTGTIWSGVILHMIKNGVAFYFLFVV
jgi:membrane protease YdiL (CAAX protease family)